MVGIGIPIPILNEEIAKQTAITNDMIETNMIDYGVAIRDRPVVRTVTYEELLSGSVDVEGLEVKTASLSSFKIARKIMKETKEWIDKGEFTFCEDIERLSQKEKVKPMKVSKASPKVNAVMTKRVHTAQCPDSLKSVSKLMIDKGVDQIPIGCFRGNSHFI